MVTLSLEQFLKTVCMIDHTEFLKFGKYLIKNYLIIFYYKGSTLPNGSLIYGSVNTDTGGGARCLIEIGSIL